MAGKVGRGPSRHGMARQAGLGKAWHGPSWCGAAWQARPGGVWYGGVRQGTVIHRK